MATLGAAAYARPADAIVVLGARAYADGRPSPVLADRVRTGCALYRRGLAPRVVLSGGPGDGDVHETEAMRRLAVAEGVPDGSIVLDPAGTSTRATVVNSLALLGDAAPRVLVVSQGWHLPRLDLAFERRGARAFTVPAVESRPIAKTPWFVAREVAAWWAEWLAGA
jgi:vancomycin permeability regulator SanA